MTSEIPEIAALRGEHNFPSSAHTENGEMFSWKLDTCDRLAAAGRDTWFLSPFGNTEAQKKGSKAIYFVRNCLPFKCSCLVAAFITWKEAVLIEL